jgi:eukaryotic-like serine/threonine-protein kinase
MQRRLTIVVLALALAQGAGATIVGWVGIPLIGESVPQVAVPDVTGLDETDATTAIEAEGLSVGMVTDGCSTVMIGLALRSVPSAGTLVAEMSSVNLVLSTGDACKASRPGVTIPGVRMRAL